MSNKLDEIKAAFALVWKKLEEHDNLLEKLEEAVTRPGQTAVHQKNFISDTEMKRVEEWRLLEAEKAKKLAAAAELKAVRDAFNKAQAELVGKKAEVAKMFGTDFASNLDPNVQKKRSKRDKGKFYNNPRNTALREGMRKLGLSGNRMASIVNVHPSHISNVKNGHDPVPSNWDQKLTSNGIYVPAIMAAVR